jgi:flagellin
VSTFDFGIDETQINKPLTEGTQSSSTIAESGMAITVTEQGVGTPTTFTISASSTMDELVDNINNETGGVVTANLNDDGKLVLSNSTGAAITVEDDSTSGSGFSKTATTFNGFLKLEGLDDEPIRITAGNKGLAAVGNEADLASIGFREVTADTLSDGFTVIGAELSSPASSLAQGDLTINGVEIFDTEISVNSLSDKLTLINSKAAETGVTASAFFSKSFTIADEDLAIGDTIEINGTDVTLAAATVADLVTKINAKTAETGISASANGSNVTLEGENVQTVSIGYKSEAEIEAGFTNVTTQDSLAINVTSGSANTSNGQASTIVLDSSDVVVGRSYRLEITAAAGSGASDIDVSYTAVTGDDAQKVMRGLRDAMIVQRSSLLGLQADTIDVESVSGTMTLAATLQYGMSTFDFGIDETKINETLGTAATHNARLKLDSVNNTPIKIDLGQNTTDANHAANHGLLESGVGAADFDVNEPTLSAAGGTSMSGLTVADAASATKALGTIDNAIDTVNSIRGDLGALQNRLEYTINNLSSISNATTGARGRILDADFAKTTSELTKHQILTQAATSMLAQANQSKQGILALLQG